MRKKIAVIVAVALIVAAASVAGLALTACGSSSGAAAASSASQPASASQAAPAGQPADMSATFTKALDTLVQDGTITSDQQSAVIKALEASAPSSNAPPAGGQSAAGSTPPTMPDPTEMFSSSLDPLVTDGTISSAQETAIITALGAALPAAPSQS